VRRLQFIGLCLGLFRCCSVRKDSSTSFAILVASADQKKAEKHSAAFDGVDITIEYGDHSAALQNVVAALEEAKNYAGT
jgi:hypothetical protein